MKMGELEGVLAIYDKSWPNALITKESKLETIINYLNDLEKDIEPRDAYDHLRQFAIGVVSLDSEDLGESIPYALSYSDLPRTSQDYYTVSHSCFKRCRVSILDYRGYPDRQFNFILVTQDIDTKYIILRPLKTKDPVEVYGKLSGIFSLFGAPSVIHVASKIQLDTYLNENNPFCEGYKINFEISKVSGEEEEELKNIDNMILEWIDVNQSSKWSHGLDLIQFRQNGKYNDVIQSTPFEAFLKPNYKYIRTAVRPHTEIDTGHGSLFSSNENLDNSDMKIINAQISSSDKLKKGIVAIEKTEVKKIRKENDELTKDSPTNSKTKGGDKKKEEKEVAEYAKILGEICNKKRKVGKTGEPARDNELQKKVPEDIFLEEESIVSNQVEHELGGLEQSASCDDNCYLCALDEVDGEAEVEEEVGHPRRSQQTAEYQTNKIPPIETEDEEDASAEQKDEVPPIETEEKEDAATEEEERRTSIRIIEAIKEETIIEETTEETVVEETNVLVEGDNLSKSDTRSGSSESSLKCVVCERIRQSINSNQNGKKPIDAPEGRKESTAREDKSEVPKEMGIKLDEDDVQGICPCLTRTMVCQKFIESRNKGEEPVCVVHSQAPKEDRHKIGEVVKEIHIKLLRVTDVDKDDVTLVCPCLTRPTVYYKFKEASLVEEPDSQNGGNNSAMCVICMKEKTGPVPEFDSSAIDIRNGDKQEKPGSRKSDSKAAKCVICKKEQGGPVAEIEDKELERKLQFGGRKKSSCPDCIFCRKRRKISKNNNQPGVTKNDASDEKGRPDRDEQPGLDEETPATEEKPVLDGDTPTAEENTVLDEETPAILTTEEQPSPDPQGEGNLAQQAETVTTEEMEKTVGYACKSKLIPITAEPIENQPKQPEEPPIQSEEPPEFDEEPQLEETVATPKKTKRSSLCPKHALEPVQGKSQDSNQSPKKKSSDAMLDMCPQCKKKKMKNSRGCKKGESMDQIKVGTTVRVRVPMSERRKSQPTQILGIVMGMTIKNGGNGVNYTIGTKFGILKEAFQLDQLACCQKKLLSLSDVPQRRCSLQAMIQNPVDPSEEEPERCNCGKGIFCDPRYSYKTSLSPQDSSH